MVPFVSNRPKDLLRSSFDHEFIRKRLPPAEGERAYLGLPGEDLLDVIEWQDSLERMACIHREAASIDMMKTAASDAGIAPRCEFYRGDIDTVLRTGTDNDNQPLVDRPYQVVNLDYEGALVQDPGGRRLEAIRSLFQSQQEHQVDFVMFVTVGPRGRFGNAPSLGLRQIERGLRRYGIDASESVSWYHRQPDNRHVWKVYVPYALAARARAFRYELAAWVPFSYAGTGGVPMMHFAMHFRYARDELVAEDVPLTLLLTSRLYIVGERIEPDSTQPPALSPARGPPGAGASPHGR